MPKMDAGFVVTTGQSRPHPEYKLVLPGTGSSLHKTLPQERNYTCHV